MKFPGEWMRAKGGPIVCVNAIAFAVLLWSNASFGQSDPRPPSDADEAQSAATEVREVAPATDGQPEEEAPLPPDRIEALLRDLDPNLLNLSGAELEVEVVGDKVILRGNEEDLRIVELLVMMLEGTAQQKVLRVITVKEKDANDIARTVEPALQSVFFHPNQRPEHELSVVALSGNIILASALPEQIDVVVEVIKQVDSVEDALPEPEQLVFPIRHRRASDVAEQLTEIIGKMRERQGLVGAKGEIQIIPNDANNSIMVLAPEAERAKFERIIKELDVEPVKGWGEVKLTIFPLLHSNAQEMATVIEDLLASPATREVAEEVIYRMQISRALPDGTIEELPPIDLQRPTRIIPDQGTQSLIVATVEENVGPIGDLIRLMDGVPMGADLGVQLFPLRFADAETVRDLLREMFDQSRQKGLTQDPDGSGEGGVPPGLVGKALVYEVGVFADARTNTVMVSGRQEHLLLVTQVISDLDQPATALKFPLRFIQFEHTDVSQVARIVRELFDQRFEAAQATGVNRAALERERVFLSVDIRSNSLIISASEENYNEIEQIAAQLDTQPAKLFDQIRLVRCHRLSATDLQQKIEELWQRKAELRREGELLEDLPVVAVDERSNALIIASSIEDYEEIKRLVEVLEAQPVLEDTELFKLDYADATALAGMLDELFQGLAGQVEAFEAPTILSDPRSNALLVAGSRDALERAAGLVARLDVQAGPTTAVFQVYPLQYAPSSRLAESMNELFDARREGQQAERTPIVIFSDDGSNSLVVSASRDDHQVVVDLLGLLDRPSSLSRQFQIYPLRLARAERVADALQTLFQAQADGGRGRADAIATAADERTNSIIVWASPSQMENIAEVIARLDTAAPTKDMMIKVIQLRQAVAQDFAELLRSTLLGEGGDAERAMIISWARKQPDGAEQIQKLLSQEIRIEPDPRTNSLMVMAPHESMDMLEAMIREFDAIRPIRSELRLFPLVNADASSMVDQLEQIFEPQQGEGETESRLVFGNTIDDFDVASVGQYLRFSADQRTNTVIAAGAEVDLRMVEDLVRYLDSQAAEDRMTHVYKVNYQSAQTLQTALQGFNDQEEQVLGAAEDEEARARRMERQISVQNVGDEEAGSSALIVGTSRRNFQQVMDMIRTLDSPEPQVRISVVVAEVTLSDELDFGIEFAAQDLTFSRSAVVGPNGIVTGSDFDFVGGTNLGAAGSGLGFNFTITGEDFSFLLNALQQNSRLEILSRPTLVVRNGGEGNIAIADSIPIVGSSQISDTGSTNTVVDRQDVGIILTTIPHISPDGYVTIEVTQEISNFAGENIQITEGVSQPIISRREVITNVTVRDGETIVIGGLITTRRSEGETKVPILGDLPIVGVLFRATSISDTKTELLVAMTVDVLRTDEDMRRMSIAERDRFVLPDSIRTNPLMEGLRILPDPSLMGPRRDRLEEDGQPEAEPSNRYGPRPRTFGPDVPRTTPTTTTTTEAAARTYGPKVARTKGTAGE